MAFSFGFTGDDVDENDAELGIHDGAVDGPVRLKQAQKVLEVDNSTTAQSRPVVEHDVEELLSQLPDRLSYSTVRIESPTGRVAFLPRRELYDVRIQLMAEDDAANDEVLSDLEKSDIRSGIYEGGFKTWECSVDLASLLLDRGPRKDIDELIRCDQVIELGAGSALPSLVLFRHALQSSIPLTFTLSDYNDSVLRLITLPNLLLAWCAFSDDPQISCQDVNNGNVDLDERVIDLFKSDLLSKGIQLKFLSGPWSESLAELVPPSAPDMGLLVLGAETIYSQASTDAFVEILAVLLKRVKMAKAMIGAKRVYFGVGGSVDGFKEACRDKGAVAYEIENHGLPGMDAGVGRALIEVQMY